MVSPQMSSPSLGRSAAPMAQRAIVSRAGAVEITQGRPLFACQHVSLHAEGVD